MSHSNPSDQGATELDVAARDLAALVRRAHEGMPQRVVDPEGREVVLVSADLWRARTESLREFLRTGGKGPDEDPLDDLIG